MKEFKALSLKTPGRHESPAPRREEALSFRFLSVYYPTTSLPDFSRALLPSESGEAFKKMVDSGMDLTNETFAKVLGVSVRTIKLWKNKLGISKQVRKLSEEDKKKIIALYKEGYTQQQIAEMFGVAQQRVSQILEEYKEGKIAHLVSSPSPTSDQELPSSNNTKLIDATPYLKGGGREREEEVNEDLKEEVIDEEEDDDIEELEREIEEKLERESRRIIASSMSKTEWRFLA